MADMFVADLAAARLMAIVRGSGAAASEACALALMDAGVRLVEVSLTTADALHVIRAVRESAPTGCSIGAGTVLTEQDAADVAAAGAQFVVTPAVTPSIEAAVRLGLPVVAGALTPTEAVLAMHEGASMVKLFPASLGGPGYLRSLREPLPNIRFLAVGGVSLADVSAYLAAGALGVGVGRPLIGDAADGGDLAALQDRARAYLAAVEEWSA